MSQVSAGQVLSVQSRESALSIIVAYGLMSYEYALHWATAEHSKG